MKRRTGLLFSSAVVLGLAGGAAGGFAVQHGRPPTPLPPIPHTVARAYAAAAAATPDPKTDDGAKLDGDLREQLLARPAGAREHPFRPAAGWLSIAELAETYDHPDQELPALNRQQFRRAAEAAWTAGDGAIVTIDLIQFRTSEGAAAYFADDHGSESFLTTGVPGTATGFVDRSTVKDRDGYYRGFGFVRHGTVVAEVFVSQKTVPPEVEDIVRLTKEQADRL